MERKCMERKGGGLFQGTFFFSDNLAVYEVMWENVLEPKGHR
jgi:hypothetical protein